MTNYFCTDVNDQKQSPVNEEQFKAWMARKISTSKTAIAVLALAMLLNPTLVGCGKNGSSALVGKWTLEEGQQVYEPGAFGRQTPVYAESFELLKDGTGIIEGMGITWKAENGRLSLINPLHAQTAAYKLSGARLTITQDGDRGAIYKKER